MKTELLETLQKFITDNGGRHRLADILEAEMVKYAKLNRRIYVRFDNYSNREKDFIIKNYTTMTNHQIADALDRKLFGIVDKIYRMKKQGRIVGERLQNVRGIG